MRNRQIPIKYYRDHWAKIYEILSVKTGLSNIIRSWCASDYESCGMWVEPPSKTKPGGTWRSFFFLLRSVVSGRKIPQILPIKLFSSTQNPDLWGHQIDVLTSENSWHHLNLPHGKIHVAQDTPFAQGSPPPPFAPGLRPPVGPRPLRPRGYFSWKGQCFHDCHDISCLSELCHTIFNIFNLTMTSLTRTHTSSLPNPKLVSTLSFVACVSR